MGFHLQNVQIWTWRWFWCGCRLVFSRITLRYGYQVAGFPDCFWYMVDLGGLRGVSEGLDIKLLGYLRILGFCGRRSEMVPGRR